MLSLFNFAVFLNFKHFITDNSRLSIA